MITPSDEYFMQRALSLAKQGLYSTHPNPRVGCVLVRDNQIVGEGWHEAAGLPHAEIIALQRAGELAHNATCYVTLEPCCHWGKTPPCTNALIKAGVKKVVFACEDPNPMVSGKSYLQLQAAGVRVKKNILPDQAQALNPGFFKRMRSERPYVRLKLGMSLDGRIADFKGKSQWITGEEARSDVQHWRALSSAILTSSNTVLMDDPRLTVREFPIKKQPLRVILDSKLSIPLTAKVLEEPGSVLIFTEKTKGQKRDQLMDRGVRVLTLLSDNRLVSTSDRVDLDAVLKNLCTDFQINEILIETGSILGGAFISEGLVDELILYIAPTILGHLAKPAFFMPDLKHLSEAFSLQITEVSPIGKDWRVIARFN